MNMKSITKAMNHASFTIKKHSPEILMVVGVVGTVAGTILACKATLIVNDILEETKNNCERIGEAKSLADNNQLPEGKDYSEADYKKDLTIVYVQTGAKLAKLYAPATMVFVLSLTCILSSYNVLRKRNVALAAAYATVDAGFKKYRSRVVERFGEEVDKELKHGFKAAKIEEIVKDESGKEKKVKTNITVADDPNEYSEYARFFDESNANWEKDSEYNLMFLRCEQSFANDKLKAQGYLFLNDVYDLIGIPRTKAGQVVGWIYDEENPVGDNYVDFGIYDVHRTTARDFVNGYERAILLDFNVDGNIWDKMN